MPQKTQTSATHVILKKDYWNCPITTKEIKFWNLKLKGKKKTKLLAPNDVIGELYSIFKD